MESKPYYVYVLQNPAGRFYVGLTEDLETRLNQHNAGISKWTRDKGPWQLVWQQGPMALTDARKLENHLKRQKGGAGFYAATGVKRSSGP